MPGALVRLAKRDPHHIPERPTIYTVDRNADEARASGPGERDAAPDSSTLWAKVMRAVRFVVAGVIWALTWVLPVTFMIMMSWACESDARRFGQRVTTHYGDEGDDIAIAIATADRKAGGNRALTVDVARSSWSRWRSHSRSSWPPWRAARGRSASTSRRPPEHSPPSRWSSASASPPCEGDRRRCSMLVKSHYDAHS